MLEVVEFIAAGHQKEYVFRYVPAHNLLFRFNRSQTRSPLPQDYEVVRDQGRSDFKVALEVRDALVGYRPREAKCRFMVGQEEILVAETTIRDEKEIEDALSAIPEFKSAGRALNTLFNDDRVWQ